MACLWPKHQQSYDNTTQEITTQKLPAGAIGCVFFKLEFPLPSEIRENQNKTKSGEKNKDKGKDKRRIDKGKGDVVQSSTGKATDPARSPPLFRDNEIEGQGSPSQQSDNRMSQCQMCQWEPYSGQLIYVTKAQVTPSSLASSDPNTEEDKKKHSIIKKTSFSTLFSVLESCKFTLAFYSRKAF